MKRLAITLMAAVAVLAVMFAVTDAGAAETGVYIKAVDKATGSFDETVNALKAALAAAGFDVLADYESGVESECGGFRAHNVVFVDSAYSASIVRQGPHAAYALVLRAFVYQDEKGAHVAFVNPVSINRTALGDGTEAALSEAMAKKISDAIQAGVAGTMAGEALGQMRGKGYVGGMGGGDFIKKIDTVKEGGKYEDMLDMAVKGVSSGMNGWKLVYEYRPGNVELAVLGLTKGPTEARAFHIAGDKRSGKSYRCPGLDHAGAFPVEVVVYSDKGTARMTTLDEMYRMKVYFEDAGNWAFMKNMTMPGQIQDEVEAAATSMLK